MAFRKFQEDQLRWRSGSWERNCLDNTITNTELWVFLQSLPACWVIKGPGLAAVTYLGLAGTTLDQTGPHFYRFSSLWSRPWSQLLDCSAQCSVTPTLVQSSTSVSQSVSVRLGSLSLSLSHTRSEYHLSQHNVSSQSWVGAHQHQSDRVQLSVPGEMLGLGIVLTRPQCW